MNNESSIKSRMLTLDGWGGWDLNLQPAVSQPSALALSQQAKAYMKKQTDFRFKCFEENPCFTGVTSTADLKRHSVSFSLIFFNAIDRHVCFGFTV